MDGYATWNQILDSLKVWVFLRPQQFENLKNHRELWEACVDFLNKSSQENRYIREGSEIYVVYAEPGDIM